MADVKISELPAATTPLTGTEQVPLVQSGDTKRATVTQVVAAALGFTPVNKAGDTMLGALNKALPVVFPSAASVPIGGAPSEVINISGNTNISSFDTVPAGAIRYVTFGGALTLIHNGAVLVLPGGVNLNVSNSDTAVFQSLGMGAWQCTNFLSFNHRLSQFQQAPGTLAGNSAVALGPVEALTVGAGLTLAAGVLSASVGAGSPTGMVAMFAINTPPTGWIKADGAAVSRVTYAALFATIGVTFGVGDGVTTFNVPEMRGEFARGWDDGRGVDPARAFGSAQAGEVGPHTHDIAVTDLMISGGPSMSTVDIPPNDTYATNASAGAETRPRNIALLFCIKT